jgi:aminoglycoside phosphotransferase (APT) family kinase protein
MSQPSEPAIDPRPILGSLGLPESAQATAVTGGADTALWRVDVGEDAYALRVLTVTQHQRARAELAAMRAAAQSGVPVPRCVAEGIWQGRPAMLLSWCPGEPMGEALLRQPDPARVERIARAFGRTQAAIHAVPVPPDLEATATSWLAWMPPDPALRNILQREVVPTNALLHLDYHPLNVLVDGDEISGVIDWANARAGDPRADVARTAAILQFAPVPVEMPPDAARVLRRALLAGWRQGYREVAGQPRGMAPFLAWAGQAMTADLTPRLGRPDLPWLTSAYLKRIERWTEGWRCRVGLS